MDRKEIDVESLTPDQIEQLLSHIEGTIGDARTLQARLLSAVEANQTPLADGYRSLKEWVKGRLDVSDATASDLVHLTRTDHMSEGSVDRRVATARLAEVGATERELALSAGFDIAGVGRLVAQRRRFTRTDHHKAVSGRYLCLQPSLDEGIYRIHGQLPGMDGKLVEEALTERGDQLPADPEGMTSSVGARKADALVAICQDTTTQTAGGTGGGLSVFVDATHAAPTDEEAGVFLQAGPRVGVDAIEEILCSGTVEVIARTEDGTPLSYGNKTRVVPPKLRRAVMQRDGHACTVAGCSSRYRLQVHHIVPASQHGETEPENLTTICWFHHHVAIHGLGMTIDPQVSCPEDHACISTALSTPGCVLRLDAPHRVRLRCASLPGAKIARRNIKRTSRTGH